MSEPSVKPSVTQPVKAERLMKATFMLVLYSLGLIGVLAAAGYFGCRLFQGPQAKPMTDISPPLQKRASPPSAFRPRSRATQTDSGHAGADGEREAAKQCRPGGPLYDPASSNVAMSFETLPLRDPQVAEAQSVLAKCVQDATWRERLPYIFEP